MRDRLAKERRSWNMSRIRGKDTSPEIAVRKLLHLFRIFVVAIPLCDAHAGGLDVWNERSFEAPGEILTHAAFGHAGFVVVGNKGTVLRSQTGVDWQAHTTHSNHFFYAVAYGKGVYLAAGSDQSSGLIMTSSDGEAWTRQSLPYTNAIFFGAAFCDDRFVVVGAEGALLVSTNGRNWRSVYAWGEDYAYGTGAGGGKMIVVGGEVAQIGIFEHDKLAKVLRVQNASKLRSVAYGNDGFVAVGGSLRPDILTSGDGFNWGRRPKPDALGPLADVCFGGGRFVTVEQYGYKVLSSRDGTNWTSHVTNKHKNLRGVCFGRETFLAVGSGPIILQSDPVDEREE